MFDCDTYIKLNYVLHFTKTSQNIEKIMYTCILFCRNLTIQKSSTKGNVKEESKVIVEPHKDPFPLDTGQDQRSVGRVQ